VPSKEFEHAPPSVYSRRRSVTLTVGGKECVARVVVPVELVLGAHSPQLGLELVDLPGGGELIVVPEEPEERATKLIGEVNEG
jgi:hypothetical protein